MGGGGGLMEELKANQVLINILILKKKKIIT